MTTWIEDASGGRDRGPRALARAWVEVLVRPRRFFRNGVAPADQAPGLVFGVLVGLGHAGTRLAVDDPFRLPGGDPVTMPPFVAEGGMLGAVFVLLAVGFFLVPGLVHLVAAVETVGLMALAPDRGGVSETVQVVAYATAPCLLSGLPSPELRVACAAYGTGLLVVGTAVRHGTSLPRAAAVAAVPALLVFGLAFGGLAALGALG